MVTEERRGRSKRKDERKQQRKELGFRASPTPKRHLLGNGGVGCFCTFCNPALSRRLTEKAYNTRVARSFEDDA